MNTAPEQELKDPAVPSLAVMNIPKQSNEQWKLQDGKWRTKWPGWKKKT